MEFVGQVLDVINKAGVVGILVLILIGGQKGWWVFGWQYRALEVAHDRWMEAALRSTNLAERTVEARPVQK